MKQAQARVADAASKDQVKAQMRRSAEKRRSSRQLNYVRCRKWTALTHVGIELWDSDSRRDSGHLPDANGR